MRDRASTEDLITPCVSLLNSLSLHKVRDDWVDSIWDALCGMAKVDEPVFAALGST